MTHKDIYTKFMIEYDKANVTSSYPSLTQYEVATLLDKAYLALIARKFTGNNPRQQAFETDIKNMSDLQPLVVNSSPSLGIEGRPAPNVMSFGLPNDYLYYVQTALRLTMTGNPLDGVTNRAVPVKLVPHELATKFFSTPYNMPWVKNPVCYQENGKVFVVYDPVKSPDTKIADFVYIKYPKPFVLGIPDAPAYEDDGDIMDIPEDTNQGGHEDPSQSGGDTTPTNPSLGGSQTPENPNQGGSLTPENPNQGENENPNQGGSTQPSTQWDSSYRIEKTKVGSTPYWCTLYVKVYHNDEQLIPDKNDFVHIIETDGVLQSQTVNITVFTEGEVRIAIRKIEGLSSQATSTITLIYANKVQKEFVVNLALTDVEINPDPTPVNPDPTPISANAYLVVNETYSSALENEITLKFNGEAATYFANKKGGAIFYVATSKNSSTWKELYRMWFGTSDGGRSFKILKHVDEDNTEWPHYQKIYYIKADIYENEEFRQLMYNTEPAEVKNTTTSVETSNDHSAIRITLQLTRVNGSLVHRLTATVVNSDLQKWISRYYLEIQKCYNEWLWSLNPALLTVLSADNNYTATVDVPYETMSHARAKLWSYNPPEGLAFNYYSNPVQIDHS